MKCSKCSAEDDLVSTKTWGILCNTWYVELTPYIDRTIKSNKPSPDSILSMESELHILKYHSMGS